MRRGAQRTHRNEIIDNALEQIRANELAAAKRTAEMFREREAAVLNQVMAGEEVTICGYPYVPKPSVDRIAAVLYWYDHPNSLWQPRTADEKRPYLSRAEDVVADFTGDCMFIGGPPIEATP